MSIFSNLLGHASEINPKELEKDFSNVLFENEQIHSVYKIFRDKWIFTNKRLIMLDIQGINGKKKNIISYHIKQSLIFL